MIENDKKLQNEFALTSEDTYQHAIMLLMLKGKFIKLSILPWL